MAGKQKPAACAQMEQDLVLYHYGELESAEQSRVQTHTERCEGCREYLREIQAILALTSDADEPNEEFWSTYSREMRHKLAEIDERPPWWVRLGAWVRPWALPAFAATAVVAIALAFTLGRGVQRQPEVPVADEALMEALPVAEKLDFFSHMELLDSLELLESAGAANGEA
jgi:anti-sigma factor RsiW